MTDRIDIFRNFIDSNLTKKPAECRLILSINEIRDHDRELCNDIMENPLSTIPLILDEIRKIGYISIGFSGSFGNLFTPRTLRSSQLSKMICLEGIIVSCSTIKPKMVKSVHYSKKAGTFYEKEYRDSTMITRLPNTSTSYPLKDSNGPLQTEFGLSQFQDFETLCVQELVEKAPPGQLPRSAEVILTEDLVDKVKPGDKIKFYGIYKSIGSINQGFPSRFRTVLIANNLEKVENTEDDNFDLFSSLQEKLKMEKAMKGVVGVEKEAKYPQNMDDLTAEIKKIFSQLEDVVSVISKSIAPSIFGYELLKKALALLLVGGNEVVRRNHSRIRGDINILMVGDPSTAKSQFLRYIHSIADLSILTAGRGSTGVGLTAAVTVDNEGEKKLEAGAMVLGDRGVVCIDEFDKMEEDDRIALHEVMEQQTVTISKSGIHATLNSRCSVLAAANPVTGQYKESWTPSQNIGLMESLLTRFDLVFILLDNLTEKEDELISNYVVNNHTSLESDQGIFDENGFVNQECLKIYLSEAKKLKPFLSDEAVQFISQSFVSMRQEGSSVVTITPRILETLIRLSTAHAKLRMSTEVQKIDALSAVELLNSTLFVRKKESIKKIKIQKDETNQKDTNELISKALFDYREKNPDCNAITLKDFLKEIHKVKHLKEEEVREALMQLHSMDIILFYDESIFFLN